MPAGVKPYKPKPKGRPAQSVPRAAAAAEAAKPKLPAYVASRRGGPPAAAAPPTPAARPVTQFGSTYQGGLPLYAAQRQGAPGAFGMATQPLTMSTLPMYPALRQNLPGAFTQAAAGLPAYVPRYSPYTGHIPPYGQARPPARQGVMNKGVQAVTARPYVEVLPPEEEAAYAAPEAGAYYPTDYGAGYEDTGGGGYGGYGGGGGGGEYPPREVPPWYYGLISWRF